MDQLRADHTNKTIAQLCWWKRNFHLPKSSHYVLGRVVNLLQNAKINIAYQIFIKCNNLDPLSFIAFSSYHLDLLTEYSFLRPSLREVNKVVDSWQIVLKSSTNSEMWGKWEQKEAVFICYFPWEKNVLFFYF